MPETHNEIELCQAAAEWARKELAMRDAGSIGDDYDAFVKGLAAQAAREVDDGPERV